MVGVDDSATTHKRRNRFKNFKELYEKWIVVADVSEKKLHQNLKME